MTDESQIAKALTPAQRKALLWIHNPKINPRVDDIFRHGNAVADLRDARLARRERRTYGQVTVLTRAGRAVAAELESTNAL